MDHQSRPGSILEPSLHLVTGETHQNSLEQGIPGRANHHLAGKVTSTGITKGHPAIQKLDFLSVYNSKTYNLFGVCISVYMYMYIHVCVYLSVMNMYIMYVCIYIYIIMYVCMCIS